MFLQKLEIQGFKSFASKSVFTFPSGSTIQKSIAGVVGPNGSGKSNIADAIRWVLGEQSLKNLRSKKSEDVIFFGSDKKSQLGSCEVSLFFNNEDHRLPLDYSEIVITRRLYRNGESEYYLNKNRVRLADITLLMAQAHVGQKSTSVISQGMADSIINASPSERKEFFDEAAGVRQYQIKKDQAANRLKNTEENIKQSETILAELEPKLKFFQRQQRRLEQREELEKKFYDLSCGYFATQWNTLSQRIKTETSRQKEIKENVTQHEKEYSELQKDFLSRERENMRGGNDGFSVVKQHYEKEFKEKQNFIAELAVCEGRLRISLEQEGRSDIAWLLKRKQEVDLTLESAQATQNTFQNDLKKCEEDERVAQGALEHLEQELRTLQTAVSKDAQEQKIYSSEEILHELQEFVALSQKQYTSDTTPDNLKTAFEHLIEKINNLIARVRTLARKDAPVNESAHNQLKDLTHKREELLHQYADLRASVHIKKEAYKSIQNECRKNEDEKMKLEKEISYFESSSKEEQKDILIQEKQRLEVIIRESEDHLKETQKILSAYYEKEKESQRELLELQKNLNRKQRDTEEIKKQETECQLELAKLTTHQEDLLHTLMQGLRCDDSIQEKLLEGTETVDSLFGFSTLPPITSLEEARRDIERLRLTLEQIGSIDTEALAEYESTKERHEFLTIQLADLRQAVETLTKSLSELDLIIRERFDVSLKEINKKFEEYFKHLFSGGSAHLLIQKKESATPSQDPLEQASFEEEQEDDEDRVSGIEIQATPPGKKLKSVNFLSGGEKAMTSIALLCAILAVNPSPFVVLDEVDAALDESNAVRFASIIRDLASQTQFILITHNRATIHTADVLYGITMGQDGISHALSLDMQKAHDTIS